MRKEQIQQLLAEDPEKLVFNFTGNCHDCNDQITVSIFRDASETDGFFVIGGAIYQPENAGGKQFLKCDPCFIKDPILRNYREIDTYSRVSGYLSPSRQYNAGKLAEFKSRKMFRMATMPETTPEGLHTPCQCPAQT